MQRISIALSALTVYRANNIVFRLRLKSPKPRDRSRNSVGSEFQTVLSLPSQRFAVTVTGQAALTDSHLTHASSLQ